MSCFVAHSSLPILESEYKTPLSASHHSHISLYTCGSAGMDNIRQHIMYEQERNGYIYFLVICCYDVTNETTIWGNGKFWVIYILSLIAEAYLFWHCQYTLLFLSVRLCDANTTLERRWQVVEINFVFLECWIMVL